SSMSTSTISTTTLPANATCDNYQCLISAATQCEPIYATITYSNTQFPMNPDISVSGQTKYEVNKSNSANSCVLTFSSPTTSLSVSIKGREDLIAKGLTDAQITAQVKAMNDSSKLAASFQNICTSSPKIIVSYLTAMENGATIQGTTNAEESIGSSNETMTYTMPDNQELTCAVVSSAGSTIYLSPSIGDIITKGIEFKLNSLTSNQLNLTITDHNTGKSQTISMVPNDSTAFAGHTITLTSITNSNNELQAAINYK
ncbi:MAG: hypothetical protein M1334_00285, partial [Patescibacteria group bacterium]|nr:hypothetical protein [Patescibacteria group bacterium]